MKTLLSIDFDFFIRELFDWNFCHSEDDNIFLNEIWNIRYSQVNLYSETDISSYGDFNPLLMKEILKELGFKINNYNISIADSHKEIYNILKKYKGMKVINFDAHHDSYENGKEIDCGNWVYEGIRNNYIKKAYWISPSWLSSFDNHYLKNYKVKTLFKKKFKHLPFNILKKGDFSGTKIDEVFICRSGAWVPPHHDLDFVEFCDYMGNKNNLLKYIRNYPTEDEAKKLYEQNKKTMLKIRNIVPANSVIT